MGRVVATVLCMVAFALIAMAGPKRHERRALFACSVCGILFGIQFISLALSN